MTRSVLSIPSYIAEGLKRNRERRSAVSYYTKGSLS
ncbi:TPA: hypothetical protein NKV59_001581 [Vibrio parahaemolyticus]|nr:hypothetical protein [Vibrio parahaemolyticus]